MAYLRSFAVILTCLLAGKAIQHYAHLAIPGSIIGMLLLFLMLSAGIIPSHWAKEGCHLMIRHMALLFVPVAVGLVNYLDLIAENTLPILLSTLGSSLIVFLVLGIIVDRKEKQ